MRTSVRLTRAAFGLAIFALLTATSQAEDYVYSTNNGTITIIWYNGPGGMVTIPEEINGLRVTGLGDSVFRNGTSVTSVTIPNSVVSLGEAVFMRCSSLTNVIIGNGVKGDERRWIGSKRNAEREQLTPSAIKERGRQLMDESLRVGRR